MSRLKVMTLAAVAGLALTAAHAPAQAATVATLSATYDGLLDNAVFTITNTTASSELVTLITSLAPNTTVALPALAGMASEQYSFNRISGGFETDPFGAGTPDTTTYRLEIGSGSSALFSAAFSPIANLTGNYVDFLGNTCQGFAIGCTVALSGQVALVSSAAATVPEPFTPAMLMTGLVAMAVLRRRVR